MRSGHLLTYYRLFLCVFLQHTQTHTHITFFSVGFGFSDFLCAYCPRLIRHLAGFLLCQTIIICNILSPVYWFSLLSMQYSSYFDFVFLDFYPSNLSKSKPIQID